MGSSVQDIKGCGRTVYLVVPIWPGGTSGHHLGSSLVQALQIEREELILVQLGPERVFKATTWVREEDFFEHFHQKAKMFLEKIIWVERERERPSRS